MTLALLAVLTTTFAAAQVSCEGDINSKCECKSLFAYRILEKAIDAGATPANCDDVLGVEVAPFTYSPFGVPTAMCLASQSANSCRADWYASPPEIANLGNPGNSHRAQWVPRCADGTDTCGNDEAVCQDGTRPMIYVDQAVDSAGQNMLANVWIFYLGGEGGPCHDRAQARSGRVTSSCWDNYRFGGTKSKSEFKKAMSSMHPDFAAVNQSTTLRGLLGDSAQVAKKMTACTDDGNGKWTADTRSFAEMLFRWLIYDDEYFAVEDDRGAAVPASPHWVTGDGRTIICGHPRQDDGTPTGDPAWRQGAQQRHRP